jgi:serine/threonine protein kinase
MELVHGIDVGTILQTSAIPSELAALIARDVLDGLHHVHRAVGADGRPLNITHRDVSPGNILVSWRGDVKVAGFGIARALGTRARMATGSRIGAFDHLCPEQATGRPLDPRSDVFSVGTVLAEMVMGRALFRADTDIGTLERIRDANLDRLDPRPFTPALFALTKRALERRPADRWQSAAEFRDAIDARATPAGPDMLARWLERFGGGGREATRPPDMRS